MRKDLPHPEGEEDPEKEGVFISEWEHRIWKFRRAMEIILFDEDAELEKDTDLINVKIEAKKGNIPDEYYLYLIGAFDTYVLDLPVNWVLAHEIIKEIKLVQTENELFNQRNKRS